MNFLRCFALGMIGGLLQGTVSQAKEPTSEFQVNLVLSTASRTEATSARSTTVMRRIELLSSDYSVGPTKDVFEKRELSSRRQMGYLMSAWQVDYQCMLQPVFGNCTEGKSKTKYYYSTQVDHCLPHVFRGCKRHKMSNQFDTLDDCSNHCKGSALMPSWTPDVGFLRCKLQPISGRCLGSITITPGVQPVVFFEKSTPCTEEVVVRGRPLSLPPPAGRTFADVLIQDGLLTGLCSRYYWDVNDRICKRFEYGGCSGNLNRFEAESHCLNHCKDDDPKIPDFMEAEPTQLSSSTTPLSFDIPATTGDSVYLTFN